MGAWVRSGIPVVVGIFALGLIAAAPPPEKGRGIVSADTELASRAGAEMLRKGGNAADAAVAAALASGVVQPSASGLGGGGFAVVVSPDGKRSVLDFREVAPAAAARDMFLGADGKVVPGRSTVGGLAVAVPAEARGLWTLHERFGELPAKTVAEAAARLASDGFDVGPQLANRLSITKHAEVQALFSVGGQVAREGDVVRQQALARTIRQWAATRGEVLHSGPGAKAVVAEVKAAGGLLTEADLAAWKPVDREPVVASYRGYTVVTMPPPSSGGVVLAQMFGVLEGYDVKELGHGSADHAHLLAEVMKHAYADRAHFLGDPDFADVPVQRLTGPERVDEVRRAIWPGRTQPTEAYGLPVEPPKDAGTEHISALDPDGMAVALTTTINTSFGSGLVVEPLGVILNNQMDDFAAAPGVPNAFGLVQGEANAIAPGKRPLSSMSPTVLLDPDGRVVMVVGASGGSQIISGVLQVVSNVVDFGMDPQEAVAAPRVHHQWLPDELVVEPGTPREVVAGLEGRGHVVVVKDHFSSVQVVVRGPDGVLSGGADPRNGGWPAGVWSGQ
jgi:gamma-glutamyltranspeptidase/glutathione hydrolase